LHNKLNGKKIMRKYLLTISSLFALTIGYAQTDVDNKAADSTKTGAEYNKWSIEANVGQNKPEKPFAPGYFSSDPTRYFNFSDVNHFDLGVRYMFNQYFGAKLDFAYDFMQDQNGNGSLPFETRQYRVGLQGVANIGRLLKFETFTSRFNILGHAGLQVSQLAPQMGENSDVTEDNGGLMIGLTPQFRITNRLVLTGDVTYLSNIRQHMNWDGSYSLDSNNLTGSMINASVGITYYLGSKDIHADWYIAADELKEKLDDVEKRLAGVEKDLKDTDDDGVADLFDVEPNTPANTLVDTKGRTLDKNKNGVPDNVENYITNNNNNNKGGDGVDLKKLINDKYVVVYFDFDVRNKPTDASIGAINFMVRYLTDNPSAKADVVGYADELGTNEYNSVLSRDRAELVKRILMDAGIDGSRLNPIEMGEDNSVDPKSESARALVRRVTFTIK